MKNELSIPPPRPSDTTDLSPLNYVIMTEEEDCITITGL